MSPRSRAHSTVELTVATALALVLAGSHLAGTATEARALHDARADAAAQAALDDAAERLRAGVLAPPATSQALPAERGVTLVLEREPGEARLERPGVSVVRLRATTPGGPPRERRVLVREEAR